MATGTIGAKIVLEGEAQYRKALRDIKTEQAELRSEMKLAQSEYSKAQNSMDALTKKHTILSKQLEASAKKVQVYEKALQTSTEKEAKSKQRVDELTKTLAKLETEQKQMAESTQTTAEALEDQEKQIAETRRQLEIANKDYDKAVESSKKYQTQLNHANAELNDINNALKDNEKYLDEARMSTDGCATSIDELGKQTKETEIEVDAFGDVLKANLASEAIVSGLKSLVNGIKEIATACIDSGMAFEASMSNVKALSGATNQELERMASKAKELGASTIYSASEVADAMSYMALAGWNTQQTLEGISPVLNLAAAASMDLAEASDIVTDNLTAFGLTAEDAGKFTDQLAYAMANSNTTVEMLGESYKNVAATASSLGYSVEDVTGALMTMANAGVKGGEAGTSLRAIMINLATDTNNCASALSEFGVEIYDTTTGKMRNLSDILVDTAKAFEGLSEEEANALSKTIAGKTQYTGFQTLMLGMSDAAKEAGMSMTDYADALNNVNGYAKEMANTMQDNLKGKLTALGSAMEGLKIATYEVFDDTLKSGVEGATDAVSRLTKSVASGSLNTSLSKLANLSNQLIDKMVKWSEENLPKLIDGLANVLDHAEDIGAAVRTMITAFVSFKSASIAMNIATTAMKAYATATKIAKGEQLAMNVAANANPYVLLAGAITGLVVATVAFSKQAVDSINDMHKMSEESQTLVNNTEAFTESLRNSTQAREDARVSMETQADVALDLVDSLEKMQDEYANGADNMLQMQNVVDQLNQLYPDLNLVIDKHTGLTNLDTNAIRDNINESLRVAKVQAAQEDLLEIAKDQYETEKRLKDLEEQRTAKQKEKDDLLQKYNDHLEEYNDKLASGEVIMEEYDTTSAGLVSRIDDLNNEIDTLSESIETEQNNLESLGNEYADVTGYIGDNTVAVEDANEAYGGFNETLATSVELSEGASKAISDMYESVSKSLSSQLDLFSEWKEGEKIATDGLIKNLEDQTNALQEWSDNMAYLAEKGIDEGLYAKLAEMGVEGANYVQAFVDMTKDAKAWDEYQENFRDALELKDSVAKEITEQYAETAGYILEGMSLGLSEDDTVIASMGTVSEDLWKKFMEDNGIHSPSTVYEDLAKFITAGMALGLEDGTSDVLRAMQTVSENIKNVASSSLSAGNFISIGQNIASGLAQGLSSGSGAVIGAVKDMCDKVISTAQTTLDIHSPSKKFEWLGEMSGEGYIEGLEASINDVDGTIKTAMSSYDTMGTMSAQSGSPLSEIVNILTEYLPELANTDTNVNVSLQGDAKNLFTAIQRQNSLYKKSTGRSAFA